jgi:hypothetical protein
VRNSSYQNTPPPHFSPALTHLQTATTLNTKPKISRRRCFNANHNPPKPKNSAADAAAANANDNAQKVLSEEEYAKGKAEADAVAKKAWEEAQKVNAASSEATADSGAGKALRGR